MECYNMKKVNVSVTKQSIRGQINLKFKCCREIKNPNTPNLHISNIDGNHIKIVE